MDINRINQAREIAGALHSDRNLMYGKFPYIYHLDCAASFGYAFIHLIEDVHQTDVMVAIYGHDTIEDTGITYNDASKLFGFEAAEIIYAVTNELGKNRKERSERTTPKIISNHLAMFVKMCDRMANMQESAKTKSGMIDKYVKETKEMVATYKLADTLEVFAEMYQELNKLISYNSKPEMPVKGAK